MRTSSTIAVAASATLMTTSLSACFLADPGPSGIEVRNDTHKTIWIDKFPEIKDNVRLKVEVEAQISWRPRSAHNDASKHRADLVS